MTTCPECKAPVETGDGPTHAYLGASAGCWKLFGELLAREYNDPEYMKVHRLTVDAYAVQHPGKPEPRTIQSINVHLLSLYHVLECDLSHQYATRAIGSAAKKNKGKFVWLSPPAELGSVTVADILEAKNAEEHSDLVHQWAKSAWDAWEPHHLKIKALAGEAL